MKTNTLAIIPQLSCDRVCEYCYEKQKSYKDELSPDDFCNFIKETLKDLDDLEEVMLDINESHIGFKNQLLESLPNDKPITITCTPATALKFQRLEDIKLNISLHDESDVALYNQKSLSDRTNYLCLMIEDINLEPKYNTKPLYVMLDKHSKNWNNFILKYDEIPKETIARLKHQSIYNKEKKEFDNCLTSVLNGTPCPAYTQLNIYRDGTKRRCPYSPEQDIDVSDDEIIGSRCFMLQRKKL